MDILRERDWNVNASVSYWTEAEVEEFLEFMEPIDSNTHPYLRNLCSQALSVGKVLRHCVGRRKTKNHMQYVVLSLTVCYYTAPDGYVTTAIHQLLVCTVIPSIARLMGVIESFRIAPHSASN